MQPITHLRSTEIVIKRSTMSLTTSPSEETTSTVIYVSPQLRMATWHQCTKPQSTLNTTSPTKKSTTQVSPIIRKRLPIWPITNQLMRVIIQQRSLPNSQHPNKNRQLLLRLPQHNLLPPLHQRANLPSLQSFFCNSDQNF